MLVYLICTCGGQALGTIVWNGFAAEIAKSWEWHEMIAVLRVEIFPDRYTFRTRMVLTIFLGLLEAGPFAGAFLAVAWR